MSSPFTERPERDHVAGNSLAFAILDGFPVSPGHTLVVPRRLVATWSEATVEERRALMALVDEVMGRLTETHCPDGFNVGFNEGRVAGQTVQHLHVHVIPRYGGDHPDPRGGIRWVLPDTADYWSGR